VAKFVTRLLMLLVAVAAVGAVYLASTKEQIAKSSPFGGGRRGGGGGGFNAADIPVPVSGVEAKRADVPLFLDGVGTAKALNTVTVRPQADGRLLKVHFREGQQIEKGTLLAEIDPTPYKAALDQVTARRAVTETQLANARRDADRYARIPGVVAQKTVDNQASQVAQFEAQLKADDAAIASARTNLDYTRVTAPISGRTGLRLVDEGNIVRAGADAGLVTITQVTPISVLFNVPQQQLQRVARAQGLGAVAVEALDADGKTVLDKGSLQVVDNQVDQTTGTIRMKADFANAQMQLWPGQFVNVRLLVETQKQVLVVPTPAIQRGPNGVFVYVATAEDRAKVRPVELSLQLEAETILKSGVEPGERIVTAGFARLQDNSRVIFARVGDAPPPATGLPGAQPKAGAGAAGATAPSGASGAGSGGGGGGGGAFARIREACGPELLIICANVAREDMRACMATNKAKFSSPCQAAMDAAAGGGGGSGKGSGEGRGKRGDAPAGAGATAPAAASGGAQAAPRQP
jgi:membrane fusion protein, multidrug efflux system